MSIFDFGKLVKFSRKGLDELSPTELGWLIADFLESKTDRFDESALEEFLNETPKNKFLLELQNRIRILEANIFHQGDSLGLWSERGRRGLRNILNDILDRKLIKSERNMD